tara:strand:+ start:948 stop:1391 length:444 start_codon:yes stop_codon:yes gene_type:complete
MNEQVKTIMKVSSELMPLARFVGKENGETFPFKGQPGIHPNTTAAGWGAECKGYDFLPININTYEGVIPSGAELILTDGGGTSAFVLTGFDEVGEFEYMVKNPVYGFAPILSQPLNFYGIEFEEDYKVYEAYMQTQMKSVPPIPTQH